MSERPCEDCGQTVVEGQPDPCIGFIEGVSAACCGHGDDSQAYVSFYRPDGSFRRMGRRVHSHDRRDAI